MSFLVDVAAGVIASAISVFAGRLYGSARPRVPRWLGSVKLTYVRSAAAGVLGISLSAGISLSTSDHTHHMVSYLLWYGVAVVALLVVLAATVVIDRQVRQDRPSAPGVSLALRPPAQQAPGKIQEMRRVATRNALAALARDAEQHERMKREIRDELRIGRATEPGTSISAELREWLAHECERGQEFVELARKEKRRLAGEVTFLEGLTMGFKPDSGAVLANLTSKARAWSAKVQQRLAGGLPGEAPAFEGEPPAAHPDPTQGDFDRLARYIEDRTDVLKVVLERVDSPLTFPK